MLELYYHPLASYCWKVLMALYENGTPFQAHFVDLADADHRAQLAGLWPFCKFPVLVDGARVVAESSIIIEYLERHRALPGSLFPSDADLSLSVRSWDRILDNYVQGPMQDIVLDRLQGRGGDMSRAHATLSTAYELLERQLGASGWLVGETLSAADCAALPALFYAVTLHPFPDHCARLAGYFERLVEQPSARRVLDEAKSYFKDYPFADAIARRFR